MGMQTENENASTETWQGPWRAMLHEGICVEVTMEWVLGCWPEQETQMQRTTQRIADTRRGHVPCSLSRPSGIGCPNRHKHLQTPSCVQMEKSV